MAAAAALTSAGTISCNKENTVEIPEERVEIHFGIDDIVTKATNISAADEIEVNNLQVFVFRADGALDAYGSAEAESLTLSCTTGDRKIYAAVNAPTLSTVSDSTVLLSKTTDLSDNSTDSFVMFGRKDENISGAQNIVVPVTRKVAKVSVNSITTDFTSAIYQGQTFTVKDIYLINVAGDAKYSLEGAPTKWYNQRRKSTELAALTVDSGINYTIANKESYNTNHSFYCYPNPTTSDTSAEIWSPRYTRLVIETTLGGITYYYPISIPGIQANHTYTVTSLKITRPGSTDPDVPVSSAECTFSVTGNDWITGTRTTETI